MGRASTRVLSGLAAACHPGPTVLVTGIVAVLGFAWGWRGWGLALGVLAVLCGQLSVGWSNDAVDAPLDQRAHRQAKPVVAGLVGPRLLWPAAIGALAIAVVLSFGAAGWIGGGCHVLALAMAWLYNLRLSRTALSWLPYAVAFGAMPAYLSFGAAGIAPPLWQPAAFAIIGASAHFANALPDLASDRAAGVGGAAVALGPRRTLVLLWVLLGAGSLLLAVEALAVWAPLALVPIAALGIAAALSGRAGAFRALMAAVAVDALVLLVILIASPL